MSDGISCKKCGGMLAPMSRFYCVNCQREIDRRKSRYNSRIMELEKKRGTHTTADERAQLRARWNAEDDAKPPKPQKVKVQEYPVFGWKIISEPGSDGFRPYGNLQIARAGKGWKPKGWQLEPGTVIAHECGSRLAMRADGLHPLDV
jgi:DNA-directed RNA polymerase subunit M/transcription elongation factor TFIIS